MKAENNQVGMKVRIILTNDFHYSGTIMESSNSFIILKDKFNKVVTINRNSILVMEEIQNE